MKRILSICTALMLCVLCTSAHADLFGERHGQPAPFETKRVETLQGRNSSSLPDDILANVTSIIGALGTKEGWMYDFEKEESVNFLGATIATFDPVPVSIEAGLLGLDGVGAGVSYNLGEALPVENVPLIKYFKYLYVGYVLGTRHDDETGWEFSHGPLISAKFTY